MTNQPCLPIRSRVDWKIKFASVFEVISEVFWYATREESVLLRLYCSDNEIICHSEPLIATKSATIFAIKKQRGSLWSENQYCKVLILLTKVFWMVETRGIEPLTSTLPALRSPSWATSPGEEGRVLASPRGFEPLLPAWKAGVLGRLDDGDRSELFWRIKLGKSIPFRTF